MASIRCNHRLSSHLLAGVLSLAGLILLSAPPAWCLGFSVHPGWPQTPGDLAGTLAIGDLDGDGQLEVVAPCEDGTVHAWYQDGSVVAGWPVDTGLHLTCEGITVADMDGDGHPEVLGTGLRRIDEYTSENEVWAFHGDGSPVVGWPKVGPMNGGASGAPAVGDIDGDGQPEVVACGGISGNARVFAWHADGTPVAGWPVQDGRLVGPSVPALGDIDGDGRLEVVVGSQWGKVFAWRGSGAPVAGWPVSYETSALGSLLESCTPAFGELDGDGHPEVVVEVDCRRVYAWHGDGSPVAGWPQGPAAGDPHYMCGGGLVVLGDLDGDGSPEVIAGCVENLGTANQTTKIYAWHGSGTLVAGWPPDLLLYRALALGDLDGDGHPEVIGDSGGDLKVLRGDGTLLATLSMPGGGLSSPSTNGKVAMAESEQGKQCAAGDLDGDGRLEVVAETQGTPFIIDSVCVWSCDAFSPDALPWAMFGRDARHSGCYGEPACPALLSSGSVAPESGDTSTQFTWKVNYCHTGNVPPSSVWVGVWCAATQTTSWRAMSALDPSDTNYQDGKWYTYSATLPAGSHAYRFAAQADGQWLYWPLPAGTYRSGPAAAPINSVVLSSGYVTPTSGTGSTNFTWRIKYWNTGNVMPDEVDVAIWFPTLRTSYWYRMWAYDPSDTNCVDGKWYTYSRKWLPAGGYSYRFAARQGTNWTYWPSPTGTYSSGPAVGP